MLIPTPQNTKTITDMREDAVGLLKSAKKQGPTYILQKSKPEAVMLSIKEFEMLMTEIEEYREAQLAAELEKIPYDKDDYVSEEQALKQLGV